MQLNLIEKSSYEILTLEEAKSYLRIDHDYDDKLIVEFIKGIRESIESIIQKPIIKRTWEYKLSDASSMDLCNEIFGDAVKISLPEPPVIKIIGVKIEDKEMDSEHYSLENKKQKSYLCIKRNNLFENKNLITIRYESGMSDCAENVPHQLKLASLIMLGDASHERFCPKQDTLISEKVKHLLSSFLTIRIK